MSKAPFLPLATDAFIGDTTGLNAAETGAYMMLLICQWRNNGLPLENNPKKLQRMTRCTKAQYNRVWPEIAHFFEVTETTISQKRVEKDFLEVLKKIQAKRESGKRGGRPKSLKINGEVKANGYNSLKLNESKPKATINHKPELEKNNENIIKEFETFWIGYGRIGSKKDALAKFKIVRRTVQYETLARAHLIYEENLKGEEWKKKRHLSSWLNQEGWNDVYPKLVKSKPSWQM